MSRPHDAGEDLLGVGPVAGAVPAQTLWVTTAGRMACSARQLVASSRRCTGKDSDRYRFADFGKAQPLFAARHALYTAR